MGKSGKEQVKIGRQVAVMGHPSGVRYVSRPAVIEGRAIIARWASTWNSNFFYKIPRTTGTWQPAEVSAVVVVVVVGVGLASLI